MKLLFQHIRVKNDPCKAVYAWYSYQEEKIKIE